MADEKGQDVGVSATDKRVGSGTDVGLEVWPGRPHELTRIILLTTTGATSIY